MIQPPALAETPKPPMVDFTPKCWRCTRTLAEYMARPWSLICRKCHAPNRSDPL